MLSLIHICTVAAPMVESNRSERPFLLQTFKSPTMDFIFWLKVRPAHWGCQTMKSMVGDLNVCSKKGLSERRCV